ncbi:uroporphyrinogen-III synthase [Tsuneonella sp. HG249]
MKQPLVVLRPEPGSTDTAVAARAAGLEVIVAPLFTIEPVAWQAPDPAHFDAMLVGSANAFRRGGRQLSGLSSLPVHAVGRRTAEAARDAGFKLGRIGEGGLQDLIALLPKPSRLLRLAAETRVQLEVPDGIVVEERIVYRAISQSMNDEARRALRNGATVLLHSAEAAREFAAQCDRLALSRDLISLAALGPRVANSAGDGWRAVRVASQVCDATLLALARDMCQ